VSGWRRRNEVLQVIRCILPFPHNSNSLTSTMFLENFIRKPTDEKERTIYSQHYKLSNILKKALKCFIQRLKYIES